MATKEDVQNELDDVRYLVTLDDIEKADKLLLKGKWTETFSVWGATEWTYIASKTKPSRLMLLVYVDNETNLLRYPMFIGGLEVIPVVVKSID